MMTSFEAIGLSAPLVSALQRTFAASTPTAIQCTAIPAILAADAAPHAASVIVESQTGSGKTLAFLLPLLQALVPAAAAASDDATSFRQRGVLAFVVAPTKELAQQIFAVVDRLLCAYSCRCVAGLLVGNDKRKAEKARIRRGLNVVVGTPGRIIDHLQNTEALCVTSLRWLVLDEADRLLDLGFERKVRQIVELVAEKRGLNAPLRFVLATATVTPALAAFVTAIAGSDAPKPVVVRALAACDDNGASSGAKLATNACSDANAISVPSTLEQKYLVVPTKLRLLALLAFLSNFLTKRRSAKIICFFACCDSVDFHFALFAHLKRFTTAAASEAKDSAAFEAKDAAAEPIDFEALPVSARSLFLGGASVCRLHGNMPHAARAAVFKAFCGAASDGILFCTDVAARGLDLPRITAIVQYDAPCDVHDYVHRIGRTARIGAAGEAILFLHAHEAAYVDVLSGMGLQRITRLSHERLLQRFDARLPTPKLVSRLNAAVEGAVDAAPALKALAASAFTSSVRAYATHDKVHRHIFDASNLHLGHFAKAFALRDTPSQIPRGSAKHGHVAKRQRTYDELNSAAVAADKRRSDARGKASAASLRAVRSVMSEFDSGL